MLSVWNIIILSGVAGAALVSLGERRYLAWVGAVLASYALSVIYWDLGLPYPEFFAGVCDLAIVAIISLKARYIWELWLGLMFLTMGFINLAYLANNLLASQLISHTAYSGLLELLNLAALFLIGGTCSFEKSGMVNGVAFRPWMHVFGVLRPAYASRRKGS